MKKIIFFFVFFLGLSFFSLKSSVYAQVCQGSCGCYSGTCSCIVGGSSCYPSCTSFYSTCNWSQCTPGVTGCCNSNNGYRTCNANGDWGTCNSCTHGCSGGSCRDCTPGATQCCITPDLKDGYKTCGTDGNWGGCNTTCAYTCGLGDCCGDTDEQCCSTGCNPNAYCNNNVCAACGAVTQPCCSWGCTGDSLECDSGICAHCGNSGELCCIDGDGNKTCNGTYTCDGTRCTSCGGELQDCCPENTCNTNYSCLSNECKCIPEKFICSGDTSLLCNLPDGNGAYAFFQTCFFIGPDGNKCNSSTGQCYPDPGSPYCTNKCDQGYSNLACSWESPDGPYYFIFCWPSYWDFLYGYPLPNFPQCIDIADCQTCHPIWEACGGDAVCPNSVCTDPSCASHIDSCNNVTCKSAPVCGVTPTPGGPSPTNTPPPGSWPSPYCSNFTYPSCVNPLGYINASVTAYNVTSVQFPMWDDLNGQDDIVWHDATQTSGDVWSVAVNQVYHPNGNINIASYLLNPDYNYANDSAVQCDVNRYITVPCPPTPTPFTAPTDLTAVCGAGGTTATFCWDDMGAPKYNIRLDSSTLPDFLPPPGPGTDPNDQWICQAYTPSADRVCTTLNVIADLPYNDWDVASTSNCQSDRVFSPQAPGFICLSSPITLTPTPAIIGCPVLNQATGLSCDTFCSDYYGSSCLDMGDNASATNNRYYYYSDINGCDEIPDSVCSDVMNNNTWDCYGKTASWTNCLCAGACATPTVTPTANPAKIRARGVLVNPDDLCDTINSSTNWTDGARFTPTGLSEQQQSGFSYVTWNNVIPGAYNINAVPPAGQSYAVSRTCFTITDFPLGWTPTSGEGSADVPEGGTLTWQVGFTQSNPWVRTEEGNVYAATTLISELPLAMPAPRVFNNDNAQGYPGIVTYGTSYDFDPGSEYGSDLVSSKNWLVNDTFTAKSLYDIFYIRLGAPITADTFDDLNNVTKPASRESPYYVIGDMATSGDWSIGATDKIIFLVNGNLTLKGKINVASGGFIAFIVNGNISVQQDVGNVITPAPDYTPDIEGVYIANKMTNGIPTAVFKTGTSETANPMLVLKGMFIADNFTLERDLGGVSNGTYPAEYFIYNPALLMSMPDIMKNTPYLWQEVKP